MTTSRVAWPAWGRGQGAPTIDRRGSWIQMVVSPRHLFPFLKVPSPLIKHGVLENRLFIGDLIFLLKPPFSWVIFQPAMFDIIYLPGDFEACWSTSCRTSFSCKGEQQRSGVGSTTSRKRRRPNGTMGDLTWSRKWWRYCTFFRPYFGSIFPYISLTYALHSPSTKLQLRFLKWWSNGMVEKTLEYEQGRCVFSWSRWSKQMVGTLSRFNALPNQWCS